jgi:hypothetical protein
MYNGKYIWPGIALFVALFSSPFWFNIGSSPYERPAIALPLTEKECIEPREYMAAEHMQLLNSWRDMALREEKRQYVASDGKKTWEISLQNTCLSCHANKADFCDKCHNANSVAPYCWDCHVEPRGNNS